MIKKSWIVSLIGILTFLCLFYCSSKKHEESSTFEEDSETEDMPFVTFEREADSGFYSSEPVQSAGSIKILSYGPIGETKGQAQIKINFGNPLIPLTTLSDKDRENILSHFLLEPEVGGKFRFLGTTTVVFEPTHSLPMATSFKVTVKQGLSDVEGSKIEEDFFWEFSTPLPKIRIYPGNGSQQVPIDVLVKIQSSTSLVMESLFQNFNLIATESGESVEFELYESDKNPSEEEDIGMYRMGRGYEYIFEPTKKLKKDTQYKIVLEAGVQTRGGNRPTIQRYESNFRTYPPFTFLQIQLLHGCGSHLTTTHELEFTNPPRFEEIEKFVIIDPSPDKDHFYQYYSSRNGIRIDDRKLEANTTYTVTIKDGLLDRFGQKIQNPQTVSFATGDLTPKMWGPSGYQIITPNIEPTLGIKTVNINSAFHKIVSLKPKNVLVRERLDSHYNIQKLLKELKTSEERVDISLNGAGVGKSYFDLKPMLSGKNFGVVAYSFRSPQVQCYQRPIEFNGLILRTNLGIFTQFHPTGGIIKINQLADGEPASNTRLKIFREDALPRLNKIWSRITGEDITEIIPCFEGTTDVNGLLILSSEEMKQCTKRNIKNKILNELYPPEADPNDILYDQERFGFAEPPRLLIIAEKGDDWTFLQTDTYGNPSIWQFGVMSAWEAERPIPRGTLFTDHQLYRPGDTVRVKGISRYLLYGKLMNGKGMELNLKLRDPLGSEKQLGTIKVNKFGTFHFKVPTKEGKHLGYYQLIAEGINRNIRYYGNYRLAEFRVPEFAVSMDINKKLILPKEPVEISWEGKYYFGAPMSSASSSLHVTRRKTYFRPEGWEKFTFGISDYLLDKKVSLSSVYLKESIDLDKSGKGTKTIKLSRDDAPYPMAYHFDVEVKDISNQTISANKQITVLPDHRLIGLKLSSWIGSKGKPSSFSVIVSSPEGAAIPDIPLRVKLMKREYHSVRSKTPDGRYTVEHNRVDKEMSIIELNSSEEPIEASFIPDSAGFYFILAELKNHPLSGTAAATSLWVAGEDYIPWEDTGEDRLEIVMDKEEYKVGDYATAFIQSPFPEAELLISVCREKTFLHDVKRVKGSAITYNFQVTENMLPNAFFSAAIFRLGDAIVPVEEEVGKHMERIGIAPFSVSLENKYLEVEISPEKSKTRPAENLWVDVQINNKEGLGKLSELTVMVVDEAVLALTGYSTPDLVKIVYAQRGLSARFNDNRPFIINEEKLLQKGTGYGGGQLGAISGPRVRKEFLKVAYYNPELNTDKLGKARFEIKMPDNLTTWRIMVVAVGEENQFGFGETKVITTQPFILRAVLPRFGRIGDQFLSGVAITNLTEGDGKVDINTELFGKALEFAESKSDISHLQIGAGESKTALFRFNAVEDGESNLKFVANFNGTFDGKQLFESDALQVPLNIKDLEATETVVAVGETTDKYKQQIKIDESIRKDVGGLDISLSSTALTNIGEGAKYLVKYPYGCLEQTVSRLLALMQLKYLSEKYNFELEAVKDVDKVIEANLKKVRLLQNSDGGFKFWPTSDESNCYLSPYVAYLIKRGRDIGYKFSNESVEILIGYLDRTLRSPCYPIITWKAKAEYRINILMGLYYLGRKDETYFEEYFNKRNQLSFGAQIQLAYLLYQSPQWNGEALEMLGEIKNGAFVTAQTAHFESPRELPPSWLFMYSPIITTSEAIKLFLEMEPESPYIAKFARYILNARKNGRWKNTYENSKAIDALVEISIKREAQTTDYTAQIFIAGNEVLKHMFEGYNYKPKEKAIQMFELPQGLNDIIISKDGQGRLYYTLSYSYRLKGAQVARQEGFSIKRIVRKSEDKEKIVAYENDPPKEISITTGDILEIELEFSVPQTGYHLVIDDPIPAGLEVIDASLKTTGSRYDSPSQQRQTRGYDDAYGYWGNPINHTELRDDRVALFSDVARPGKYIYKFLLRATTSGIFLWPAAKISLMYEPEQFGTCAEGFVNVKN